MRKKFLILCLSLFALCLTQKTFASNTILTKGYIDYSKVDVNPISITIGFTDACGVCWQYSIQAATWAGIWNTVQLIENIYELGFCGFLVFDPA